MHASRFTATALAAACLMLSQPVAAAVSLGDAAGRYAIDGNSSIRFSIANVGGGALKGGFARFRGSIRIDDRDAGRSSVDITIYPASVTTGQDRIDNFLRSDAVFDVANAPEIRFRSTSVRRTGDTSATIEGQLVARGRNGTEKFTAELLALKNGNISFHVVGRVLRSRYGMDVGTPIYSNVVDFDMTLSGHRG
jgi:polyisoprenoid-binding protein YceI